MNMAKSVKMFRLLDARGREYLSRRPGRFGGHRRLRIFGRLDCPSALRWIARGHYISQRVFFADERAVCMPAAYKRWRSSL